MESSLQIEFEAVNITVGDQSVISHAAQVCRGSGLNASDFVAKWSAYALNNSLSSVPTANDLDEFKKEIEREAGRASRNKPDITSPIIARNKDAIHTEFGSSFLSAFGVEKSTAEQIKQEQAKRRDSTGRKRHDFSSPATPKVRAVGGLNGTPVKEPVSDVASPAMPTPGAADYASRKKSGHVELAFNPSQRSATSQTATRSSPVDIGVFPNCVEKPYRFMFEKLLNRAEVLDIRIEDMSERLRKAVLKAKKGDKTQEETSFTSLAEPVQEACLVSGRVCLDAVTDGKLNAKSIVLEGSRDVSSGTRVQLDIADVPDYSLFPGQIVAAEGTNPSGDRFSASLLYQGAPPPYKRTKPKDILNFYFDDFDSSPPPVKMIVAAGPFTTKDDLSYAPLDDLLSVVRKEEPDVLILLGPFVDAEHPMIKEADLDVTFEQLYKDITDRIYNTVLEELRHTRLLMVPSLRDVTHDNVFPQAPLPAIESDRITYLANPSTITVQEMTLGLVSADVLFHISKTETSCGGGDRMARLANHILEQRSYYPLYPPASGVNVDYAHIDNLDLPVSPDILVLPSDLRFFVKRVKDTVVINPGRLTKFSTGGTYAKVTVHAPRRNDIPEDDKPVYHGIPDRTVAEILRV